MAASVWIRFSSVVWPSSSVRPLADTMPVVTVGVSPRASALPMATTWSPTCMASEDPRVAGTRSVVVAQADEGDVVARRGADEVGADRALVAQLDLDDVGAVDDVRVGQHQPVGGDDHARAGGERDHLVAAGLAELDRDDRRA